VVMTSFLTLVFQRFYCFTDHFVTPGQVPDAADADWLLRLSAVLCLGFGFVWLTGLEHAYWYPMTAFLMLMPYAEESRMKIGNRIRSTLGGAVVSVLLMSLFHTMPEYILIMAVMTCFMYYAPVTSWTMTVYSTCYGMTLAQMRLGLMESVTLRLAYVALANRFLLPMNRQLVSEIEQINAYLRSRPHLLNTGYSRMTAEVLDNLEDAILRIKLSYTKNELVPFFDTGRSPQAFGRLEDSLYFNTLAVNCLQTLRQMNDLMESKANP